MQQRANQMYVVKHHSCRRFQSQNTAAQVGNVSIGNGNTAIMAAPCAVESKSSLINTAEIAKKYGTAVLRGGARKILSSPCSFKEPGKVGLNLLYKVKNELDMPVITEILDSGDLSLF